MHMGLSQPQQNPDNMQDYCCTVQREPYQMKVKKHDGSQDTHGHTNTDNKDVRKVL
jgi:hypothetical protein